MPDGPDPIEVAARALRHRDRPRMQIDARLARAGVTDEERAEALETLERLGYVDDHRFAVARAAALAERGYGDEGIRQLLAADGADEGACERAMAVLEPEEERARRIVERHGASPRTARQLQRKGFAADVVAAAWAGIADVCAEE